MRRGQAQELPLEFGPVVPYPAQIAMIGGGSFGWKPGEWTDDTSMALVLGGAIAKHGGLDDGALDTVSAGFHDWAKSAQDVGNQTRKVLGRRAFIVAMRVIVGLKHHRRLHTWATYNGSRETALPIDDTRVQRVLEGPDGRLTIEALRFRGGLPHAPLRTAMHKRVEEALDAGVTLTHAGADGRTLFSASSDCTGMEVYGDIDRLLATKGKRV